MEEGDKKILLPCPSYLSRFVALHRSVVTNKNDSKSILQASPQLNGKIVDFERKWALMGWVPENNTVFPWEDKDLTTGKDRHLPHRVLSLRLQSRQNSLTHKQ